VRVAPAARACFLPRPAFHSPVPPTRPPFPAQHPVAAYVALGANIGDRSGFVQAGFAALAELPLTRCVVKSSIIETDPVGPVPQGRYLNAAAGLETFLPARELLDHLQGIERACGRDRSASARWGPRTLDLDLILYGQESIHEPGLIVPHPRLHERLFVLIPLAEIAPDVPVPPDGRTPAHLRDELLAGEHARLSLRPR
jgi:2-amino-4-hydroxy-6-hydroxymethyldihydropteridine diphosphokinase